MSGRRTKLTARWVVGHRDGRHCLLLEADISVFDFAHPLIGQVIDPIQTLLIGSAGRDVCDVFVAGRHVVRGGRVAGV